MKRPILAYPQIGLMDFVLPDGRLSFFIFSYMQFSILDRALFGFEHILDFPVHVNKNFRSKAASSNP